MKTQVSKIIKPVLFVLISCGVTLVLSEAMVSLWVSSSPEVRKQHSVYKKLYKSPMQRLWASGLSPYPPVKKMCSWRDLFMESKDFDFVLNTKSGCMPHANEYGFIGPRVPNTKKDGYFTIGLGGGSVAFQQFLRLSGTSGYFPLEEYLNRHYHSPTGEPFKLVSLSMPGWMMPKQQKMFEKYAGVLDGYITLDGFNEVFQILNKGDLVPFAFSNFVSEMSLGKRIVLDSLYNLLKGMRSFREGSSLINRSKLYFSTEYAVYSLVNSFSNETFPRNLNLDNSKAKEKFNFVKESFVSLESEAAKRGVLTAYFVQPVSVMKKKLVKVEQETIPQNLDKFAGAYLDYIELLKSEDLPIEDLTDVFSKAHEEIYMDIIHTLDEDSGYNRGVDIMAKSMSRSLAKRWKLEPKIASAPLEN